MSFLGFLQRLLILRLIKEINPKFSYTNTDLYSYILNNESVSTSVMPVFSNLKYNRKILPKNTIGKKITFAIFGTIHDGAPVIKFIKSIKLHYNHFSEPDFIFHFIGNSGKHIEQWTSVLVSEKIKFKIHGFCSDNFICNLLSTTDFAITTTPYLLLDKSGCVATYLDLGIPILCVSKSWNVKGYQFKNIDHKRNQFLYNTNVFLFDYLVEFPSKLTLKKFISNFQNDLLIH
jgi:hypothetical protein